MRVGFIIMLTLTLAGILFGFYDNGFQGVINLFKFPVIYLLLGATIFLWWYDKKNK